MVPLEEFLWGAFAGNSNLRRFLFSRMSGIMQGLREISVGFRGVGSRNPAGIDSKP